MNFQIARVAARQRHHVVEHYRGEIPAAGSNDQTPKAIQSSPESRVVRSVTRARVQPSCGEIHAAVHGTTVNTKQSGPIVKGQEPFKSKLLGDRNEDDEIRSLPTPEIQFETNNPDEQNPAESVHNTGNPTQVTRPRSSRRSATLRTQSAGSQGSSRRLKNWFVPSDGENRAFRNEKPRSPERTSQHDEDAGRNNAQESDDQSSPLVPETTSSSDDHSSATSDTVRETCRQEEGVAIDDPAFYNLELLVLTLPLVSNPQVDDDNCLKFPIIDDQPSHRGAPATTRSFNPIPFFSHVIKPRDLYGHCVHILVSSTAPVFRVVIDTCVHLTTPAFETHGSNANSLQQQQQKVQIQNDSFVDTIATDPPDRRASTLLPPSTPPQHSSTRNRTPVGHKHSPRSLTQKAKKTSARPQMKSTISRKEALGLHYHHHNDEGDGDCSPWDNGSDHTASLALLVTASTCPRVTSPQKSQQPTHSPSARASPDATRTHASPPPRKPPQSLQTGALSTETKKHQLRAAMQRTYCELRAVCGTPPHKPHYLNREKNMASAAPTIQESPEALARMAEAIIGERNPRGIPAAVFVESVESYMSSIGIRTIEPLVGALQQLYSKYKFMETNLQKSRDSFKRKIPETEKDLAMLKHLMSKQDEGEEIHTRFNLADNVYAKATVDCSVGKVCIWLGVCSSSLWIAVGANVMVEYSYEEALELLQNNVAVANERLTQIDADLAFLRDSIITTEVNIARIFNHDVRRRRKEKDDNLVAELEANGWSVKMASVGSEWESESTDQDGATSDAMISTTAAGWELRHDEATGQAHYYNVHTSESSWNPPTDTADRGEWTQAFDENGLVYYVNVHTSETRWEPPPGSGLEVTTDATVDAESRRMSTAEQMEELNRLLSGDDDDDDDVDAQAAESMRSSSEQVPDVNPIESLATSATPAAADQHEMPWMMFVNESDGIPYYYNHVTEECVWDPPAEYVAYRAQHAAAFPQQITLGESKAIGLQPESASSGLSETAATASTRAAHFEASITPEFEEKVRRAIESVSKTPVGSSRVLFVRTPSGAKWLEDAKNDELQVSSRELAAAADAEERSSDTPPLIIPATGRPRSSRSGSGLTSSRQRTPQAISESVALQDGDQFPLEDDEQAIDAVLMGRLGEVVPLESAKPPVSQLVEIYDPETGAFLHIAEPIDAPQVPSSLLPDDQDETAIMATTEQLRRREAALIMQCMTRCFLARHRVRQKRTDKQRVQQAENHADGEPQLTDKSVSISSEDGSGGADSAHYDSMPESVAESRQEPVQAAQTSPHELSRESDHAAALDEEDMHPLEPDNGIMCPATESMAETAVVETQGDNEDESESPSDADALASSAPANAFSAEPVPDISLPDMVSDSTNERSEPDHQESPSRPLQPTRDATHVSVLNIDAHNTAGELPVAKKSSRSRPTSANVVVPLEHATPKSQDSKLEQARGANQESKAVDEVRVQLPVSPKHSIKHATPSPRQVMNGWHSSQSLAPQVLDITSLFPKRREGKSSKSEVKSNEEAKQQSAQATGIVRKQAHLSAPVRRRAPSTLADEARQQQKEQRMQAANLVKAQKKELLAQELADYRQIYEAGVVKYQAEKKLVVDAYTESKAAAARTKARQAKASDRDASHSSEESASLWQLGCAASGYDPTQHFQNNLDKMLDPRAFATTMRRERLFTIQQRIEQLHASAQHVENQLEAIDVFLLSEDSELDELTSSSASQKVTFQSRYASKLRRKQNELLHAIEFWQQQIDIQSGKPSSSRYWERVDAHYDKFTTAAEIQQHVLHAFRNANGDSLLHAAVWNGRHEDVARLIALGADVNMLDTTVNRWTPPHEACRGGHTEIARMLLASCAKFDAVDLMGDSPLHIACRLGWSRVVHLLLSVAEEIHEEAAAPEATGDENGPVKRRNHAVMSRSLIEFFNLRNFKKHRALELVKLPSLLAYLQQYERELDVPEHSDAPHRRQKKTAVPRRKRSKAKHSK
ncbi:Prefoldin subunit 3, partial [Globisporangium splendens]